MKPSSFRLSVAVCAFAALVPLALFVSHANSQIQVTPSYTPIGAAAAGSTTMAWFHDAASGRAVACQALIAAGGGLSGVQCVAAKLP